MIAFNFFSIQWRWGLTGQSEAECATQSNSGWPHSFTRSPSGTLHSDWLQSHSGRLVKVCRQLLLSPSWCIKVILTTDNKDLPPWSPSSKHGRNNFGWSQVLHQNSAASSGHLKNCSVWRYIELWLNLFDASGFVTSGSYLQQKNLWKKQLYCKKILLWSLPVELVITHSTSEETDISPKSRRKPK